MKLKKGILLTALTLMTVSVMGMFNNVQAATSKTLSIKALRKSGFGYQVVNNSTKYIWKIYDTNDKNETFYCIKGGPGFGSSNMGQTITPTEYTQSFDMKNPDEITSKYLNAILDPDSKQYERLMWVLDQCYVQPKKNASDDEITIAQESKRNLLNAVDEYIEKHPGIYDNPSYIYDKLTDILDEYEEDIDAIQQLAVWYYTNDDDYHVNRNPTIKMNSVKDVNGNYQALDINDDEDAARIHAMNALYAYLTQTPQASGFSYDYANGAKNANPQFEDTTVEIEENGDRIIVGPYRINENSENANYSLRGTITDGNNDRITDVIFLDRNKQELRTNPTLENLKEIVEQDFYISLPSTVNQTNIEFYIEGNCFKTEVTYWSVENPGEVDQPIVQIEKTNRGFDDEKTVSKEPVPEIVEFDLALRKFITSIAGKTLTGADSRVPTISDSELRNLANKEATGINTTSANKVHRKDALTVKTGDKVVYTIRIYNEGDVDGWATEVTDHLPEGLKFVPVAQSSINQKYGWTNPSGDGKTIVTSYLASTSRKLNAFNKETYNLDYEDLQIECEVIATPEATTKHLKNIAEITAHKDINGNTGNNLTDRDSRPDSLTSDDINNYGTTSKQDDDDFEHLILQPEIPEPKEFDLALRKFITSIAGKTLTGEDSREPVITEEELARLLIKQATGIDKTSAKKEHRKDALTVKTGDKVIYTIRIYNEGEVDGWATEVTDHLPEGLKFVPAEQSSINRKYGWTNPSGDGKTIVTNYLAGESHKLNAFNGTTLDYEDVQIECEVVAVAGSSTKNLKNIAEITANKDKDGNTNVDLDRDSKPNSLTQEDIDKYGTTSKQDDDDFEQLILQPKPETEKSFDLALRKFIVDVKNPNSDKSNVLQSREPQVVVKPLLEGKTTATYNHTKEPVSVSNGDIVTYTIRVYNEGEVDGYVTEITDHLPKQLEFIIDDELNKQYGWTVVEGSSGRTVKTDITSPNTTHSASRDIIYATRRDETDKVLLRAFEYEENSKLDYIDVKIRCRVKDDISLFEKITNIADITDFTDSQGNKVEDRDSQEDNVTLPKDETLPEYKDQEINSKIEYIEGQQDDDDFEKLVLRKFDLALRKFITGVANGEKVEDITNRAPVFVNENGKYTYEHTKEPVEVANGNTVIYTLRIFNEGNVSGYATKVKDDLPEGLEFLPENIVNTAFNWKMYKEDGTETKDVKEAKYIETDFLSKEKEKEDGANLIKAFNPETMTMPDYKDLKIAFKVTEPNTSDRIIINQAQISDDSDEEGNPVDDIDSVPDEWNEGEDDQDIEKIKVKYFDLSLKKWVTEAIVTVDGKTKVTKSGTTYESRNSKW